MLAVDCFDQLFSGFAVLGRITSDPTYAPFSNEPTDSGGIIGEMIATTNSDPLWSVPTLLGTTLNFTADYWFTQPVLTPNSTLLGKEFLLFQQTFF